MSKPKARPPYKPSIKPHVAKAILKSFIKNPAEVKTKTITKTIECIECPNCKTIYEKEENIKRVNTKIKLHEEVFKCNSCKLEFCNNCSHRHNIYDILESEFNFYNEDMSIYDNVPYSIDKDKKIKDIKICDNCLKVIDRKFTTKYKRANLKIEKYANKIDKLKDDGYKIYESFVDTLVKDLKVMCK